MNLLALDLGTTTGFAVGVKGRTVSGTWNLKPNRFEGGGMRFVHFRRSLNEIREAFALRIVLYEEVRRHRGVDAAHVYGGLLATLQSWCEENGLPYSGVPVGEIKKAWVGKGNASKEEMIAEAVRRGYRPADDNEADALAILQLGIDRYPETEPMKEAA